MDYSLLPMKQTFGQATDDKGKNLLLQKKNDQVKILI
jgi:hypothetical protein